jgi:hypothetical protein
MLKEVFGVWSTVVAQVELHSLPGFRKLAPDECEIEAVFARPKRAATKRAGLSPDAHSPASYQRNVEGKKSGGEQSND